MKITPASHRKPLYPRLLLHAAAVGAVGSAAALLMRPIEIQMDVQAEQHTLGVPMDFEQIENRPDSAEMQEDEQERPEVAPPSSDN